MPDVYSHHRETFGSSSTLTLDDERQATVQTASVWIKDLAKEKITTLPNTTLINPASPTAAK